MISRRKKYYAQLVFGEDTRIYHFIKSMYTAGYRKKYILDTKKYIRWFEEQPNEPLFQGIEIETINRCNGTCPFCPVNSQIDSRIFSKMSSVLFHKIINQLSDIEYKGTIALHSNNEPLLDNRLIDFAKYARDKCKKAYIYLYSNGTLLTSEKLISLLVYLDCMYVSFYSDDVFEKNNAIIKEWEDSLRKNNISLKRLKINYRKRNEILSSRGGQSPNKNSLENQSSSKMPCLEVFKTMVIRPTGKCSLCKCDALGSITMGDANVQSLVEIWHNEKYKNIRRKLMENRLYGICKECDFPIY